MHPRDELENVARESTRTIDVDEFVPKTDTDPRHLTRPYYLIPDGKVRHDAYAVIRETIKSMKMLAFGRLVLTNRVHIIALEPLDKSLMGSLLRYPYYPYEVRNEQEYFNKIQDVKVTKDMLDLGKHIVTQRASTFEPAGGDDQVIDPLQAFKHHLDLGPSGDVRIAVSAPPIRLAAAASRSAVRPTKVT